MSFYFLFANCNEEWGFMKKYGGGDDDDTNGKVGFLLLVY